MRFRHRPPTEQCIPHRFVIDHSPARSTYPQGVDGLAGIDDTLATVRAWCRDAFDKEEDRYDPNFERRWMSMGWSVYVYRADDALAFKLRWC